MVAKYPPIPEPAADLVALRSSALALKEVTEILTQQRGVRSHSAVTWDDLLALGLILPSQIPPTPTNR